MNILQHIWYRITKARPSGLLPLTYDDRDFRFGIFGFFEYQPLNKSHIIPTKSVKNQGQLQTCGWFSSMAGKEVDEDCVLSEQDHVAYAKNNSLCGYEGISNLRDNQKVLADFGATERKAASASIGWNSYVNVDTSKLAQEASKHKSKTYWSVSSRGSILKLLDEGHPVQVGMTWYTGFNQGGGFKSPWIITKAIGVKVGGHALIVIGYDLNYQGRKVYILQNSYGSQWGDNGKLYVEMSYLEKEIANYGAYANLDIERETLDIITQYAQTNVKGDKDVAIYLISMGKKRVYPSWDIFAAWGGYTDKFKVVPQADLDKVPEGEPMKLDNAPHKEILDHLQKPIHWQ